VPRFQTSVMALATLWALSVKIGVSMKKARRFENRGRKVKIKWRLCSKRASSFLFLFLFLSLGLSGYFYFFSFNQALGILEPSG